MGLRPDDRACFFHEFLQTLELCQLIKFKLSFRPACIGAPLLRMRLRTRLYADNSVRAGTAQISSRSIGHDPYLRPDNET